MAAHESAIDMVATARATQLSDAAAQRSGAVKLVAPAKVNLQLLAGARRDDGYHAVDTVLHAVALHDVLYLRRLTGSDAQTASAAPSAARAGAQGNVVVRIECCPHEGIVPLDIPTQDNIVFRAIDALARAIDFNEPDVLDLRIEKHIPHQAGLGGGSSDAAAALMGAAQLWGIAPDDARVEAVARSLGADVAFFLHGGCARFAGTGDTFVEALPAAKNPLVIIKPEQGVSTAEAYAAFDRLASANADGKAEPGCSAAASLDENGASALSEASCAKGDSNASSDHDTSASANSQNAAVGTSCQQNAATIGGIDLRNNLTAAAETLLPELANIRSWALAQPGAQAALLCGSGSASFVVADSFSQACNIAAEAGKRGWWARATMLCSLKAAAIPKE